MIKKLYLICRYFKENSGSYSGVFETFAKYANKKGVEVTILSGWKPGNKSIENLGYATICRFHLSKWKVPLLGMNLDYLMLSIGVKRFFKYNPIKEDEMIIANGRAALGVLNKRFILRSGQPAIVPLKSMEIAKDYLSIVTRVARLIHFIPQYFLEKICYKKAEAFLFPSIMTRGHVNKVSKIKGRASFVPFSMIKQGDLK